MSSKKDKFSDREYRASYAESFLDTSIATQIRVLREQRGWTQGELAKRTGMKQSRISALEDANYSGWGTKTLKRLARAFDVPLNIMFGSFGRLLTEVNQFNRQALERPGFDQDPAFAATAHTQDAGTTPTNATQVQRDSVGNLLLFRAKAGSHPSSTLTSATTSADIATARSDARYGS